MVTLDHAHKMTPEELEERGLKSVLLNNLQVSLTLRAINTEVNLLDRLYCLNLVDFNEGRATKKVYSFGFGEQVRALREAAEALEAVWT